MSASSSGTRGRLRQADVLTGGRHSRCSAHTPEGRADHALRRDATLVAPGSRRTPAASCRADPPRAGPSRSASSGSSRASSLRVAASSGSPPLRGLLAAPVIDVERRAQIVRDRSSGASCAAARFRLRQLCSCASSSSCARSSASATWFANVCRKRRLRVTGVRGPSGGCRARRGGRAIACSGRRALRAAGQRVGPDAGRLLVIERPLGHGRRRRGSSRTVNSAAGVCEVAASPGAGLRSCPPKMSARRGGPSISAPADCRLPAELPAELVAARPCAARGRALPPPGRASRSQAADDERDDQHHHERHEVMGIRDGERERGRDEEEIEGGDAEEGREDGRAPARRRPPTTTPSR